MTSKTAKKYRSRRISGSPDIILETRSLNDYSNHRKNMNLEKHPRSIHHKCSNELSANPEAISSKGAKNKSNQKNDREQWFLIERNLHATRGSFLSIELPGFHFPLITGSLESARVWAQTSRRDACYAIPKEKVHARSARLIGWFFTILYDDRACNVSTMKIVMCKY